jgi:hypothetical protein
MRGAREARTRREKLAIKSRRESNKRGKGASGVEVAVSGWEALKLPASIN